MLLSGCRGDEEENYDGDEIPLGIVAAAARHMPALVRARARRRCCLLFRGVSAAAF